MPDELFDSIFGVEKKEKDLFDEIFTEQVKTESVREGNLTPNPEEIEGLNQAAASSTRVDTAYKQQTSEMKGPEGGPTTTDEMEYLNDNPMTQEEFSFRKGVRQWYSDRGGISPDDKIGIFMLNVEELDKQKEERGFSQEVYDGVLKRKADEMGLKLEDGEISVYPHEKEQYDKIKLQEYNKLLDRAKAAKSKDEIEAIEFVKDIFIDPLNRGSERVLDTPTNILAIGEKAVNAAVGGVANLLGKDYTPSTYMQDRAQARAVDLEKRGQMNDRYDESILSYAQNGQFGKALGATTASFMENLPLLTTLAAGNLAGASNVTLGAMGAGKGAEEYLKLDREDPDLPEFHKIINSTGKMFSEIIFEQMGTMTILNQVKKGIQRDGADVIRKQLIDAYTPQFQKNLTRLANSASPGMREAASEMATEFTDYTMDASMGIYDGDLADRLVDAGVVGFLSGQMLSAPNLRGRKSRAQVREQIDGVLSTIPEDYDIQSKVKLVPLLIEEQIRGLEVKAAPDESKTKQIRELRRQKVTEKIDAIVANEEGIAPESLEEPVVVPEKKKKDDEVTKQKTYTDVPQVRKDIRKTKEDIIEIEEELEARKEARKSPYRIYGETYENKEDFIEALGELSHEADHGTSIMADDIYGEGVSPSEITAAIGEGGGATLSVAPIRRTSTEEVSTRLQKEQGRLGELQELEKTKGKDPAVYKIGDTEYKSKETFLSEVEKLEGEENTPKVVVENDEETMAQVEEMLPEQKEQPAEEPKEKPVVKEEQAPPKEERGLDDVTDTGRTRREEEYRQEVRELEVFDEKETTDMIQEKVRRPDGEYQYALSNKQRQFRIKKVGKNWITTEDGFEINRHRTLREAEGSLSDELNREYVEQEQILFEDSKKVTPPKEKPILTEQKEGRISMQEVSKQKQEALPPEEHAKQTIASRKKTGMQEGLGEYTYTTPTGETYTIRKNRYDTGENWEIYTGKPSDETAWAGERHNTRKAAEQDLSAHLIENKKAEIKEKPKEEKVEPKKEEKRESLMASMSGITASWDVPKEGKPKKGKLGKRNQALLDMAAQVREGLFAQTDEEIAEAKEKWGQRIKDDGQKLRGKDAKKTAIELQRDLLEEYLRANSSDLKKAYGNVVPAMLKRVNKIKTEPSLRSAMKYMDDVMNRVEDREEAILWSNLYDKLLSEKKEREGLLVEAKYAQKDSDVHRAKLGVTEDLLEKIDRYKDNLLNKTRDEGIEEGLKIIENASEEGLTVEEFVRLQEMKTYGLEEMNATQLKEAVAFIKADLAGDKAAEIEKYKNKKLKEAEELDAWAQYIYGDGVMPDPEDIELSKKFKPGRWLSDFIHKNANAFSAIDRISIGEYKHNRKIKLYKSALMIKFANMIHEADNNYHDGLNSIVGKAQEKLGEIFLTMDKDGNKTKKDKKWGPAKKMALMDELNDMKREKEDVVFDPLSYAEGSSKVVNGEPVYVEKGGGVIVKTDDGWVVEDHQGNRLTEPKKKRATAVSDLQSIRPKAKKSLPYTQDEMLNAYHIMNQEDQWERLAAIPKGESMGGLIRLDARRDSPTAGQLVKTDKANAIEQQLDPRVKQWGEYMSDLLNNELYDRYNEIYKKLFVFDMPRNEGGNYFPIFAKHSKNDDTSIEDMLAGESFSEVSMNNRHVKKRVPNKTPIRNMGATDVFFSYLDKMEWFRARAEATQELRTFFKNPKIKAAISAKHGDVYNEIFNQFIDRYAGKQQEGRVPFLDKIRAKITRATLAIKPVILIKQTMSYPAFANFVPPHALLGGTIAMFAEGGGFAKNWKMLTDSSFMTNRANLQFDRDLADAVQRDYKSRRPKFDYFMDHMMFNVKWGDKIPIITGGYSVYRYNKKKYLKEGKGEEEAHKLAIRDFEQAVRYTQQASDIADLGYWQTHSSFSKMMTMYMTAPLSYQRMVSQGVRMFIAGAKGRNAPAMVEGAKAAFIGHVLLPTLFQFAAQGFEIDDDEDRKDLMWAAILGNMNNYFMMGDVMQTLIDSFRGRPWDYQATPVESLVTDTKKTMAAMRKVSDAILDGTGLSLADIGEFMRTTAKPVAYVTGWPIIGVNNVEDGIRAAIEEEEASILKKAKWAVGYSKKGLDKSDFDDNKGGRMKSR